MTENQKQTSVYLYGASGHAKVIIEILEINDITVLGLYDDNPEINKLIGFPVWHPEKQNFPSDGLFILSMGNNKHRLAITKKHSFNYYTAIHLSSIVSPSASIDEGTVIMPNSVINTGCSIGKHVIVNTSASIDHDCIIEDFAHISPNATLCGNVHIGEGTHVGAGAVIIPGIKIGKWVTIGAGAVVITNIPDYAVVVGVPAKILKYNPHE